MVTPLKATRVGVGKRYLNNTTQVVGNFGHHDDDDDDDDDDDATCSHDGRETKKERAFPESNISNSSLASLHIQ